LSEFPVLGGISRNPERPEHINEEDIKLGAKLCQLRSVVWIVKENSKAAKRELARFSANG
jgi:hypothetical protein